MADEIQNAVLLSTFRIGRKRYRVYFHRGTIIWDNEKPPHAQHTLPIENVISVQYNYVSEDSEPVNPKCFTIHYAERGEKQIWKYSYVTFEHNDPMQLSSWVKTLQNHLLTFTQRPKKLLLFVNPYGGKKKALKIFEKYGKPLFRLSGVDVSVLISQRPNQIRDIVMSHSLDVFDSVACVGGDGTFAELYNGMVLRECKKLGLDPHDIDVELPKPSLPLGVIPGGSTDTIAYCIHGTDDVTTAVLNIVFGDLLGLDLVSVYNDSRFLRLYASILSYGFLGEVAHDADQYRWMGPARYEYVGLKKLVENAGYEGEITIVSERRPEEGEKDKCFAKCSRCAEKRSSASGASADTKTESKVVSGKFFMVSGANITCACSRSPNGVAPYSHLGDGSVQLVLIRHTSFLNNVRLMLRMGSTKSDVTVDGLPFVEIHRAQEFYFRGVGGKFSKWNCDGELETDSCLKAKVRCQLINVFSRGSPKPEEDSKSTGCCGST